MASRIFWGCAGYLLTHQELPLKLLPVFLSSVRGQISGLTTAAGVWATAAIGMAVGGGMYLIGILATGFLFVVQMIFHDDSLIDKIIVHIRFNLQIEAANKHHILQKIKEELAANQVENVDGIINNKQDENDIIMALRKYPDIKRISYTRGGK